jgi:alkylation response protein AidB-like acyl-CoA dehydrogenase
VFITQTDASKYFTWKTLSDVADRHPRAEAQISLALWWAADTAARAVSQSLQTFGGYGLTLEYDIHLYNLRAKAWPLAFGDPEGLLDEGGRRLFGGESVALPDVGHVPIDFDRGEEAHHLAAEVDAFFRKHLTPELKAKAHFSWEGYDAGLHQKFAKAGLLFPDFPRELGGRDASAYAGAAAYDVWEDHEWSTSAPLVTRMIGWIIHRFGTDELKRDVLTKIIAGEALCSLGYTEPAAGSDVFAAQTRATREGDSWRIDGQKMFTSGANMSDYILLIARTNPNAAKHKGLTMFLVPVKSPGLEVQPVHTFQDEQTNITYYDGVRIPDTHRLGEVDGGARVMAAALDLEHNTGYAKTLERLLRAGEQICKEIVREGRPLIEGPNTRRRLARIFTQAQLAKVLNERMLWASVEKKPAPGWGSMTRLQSAEAFLDGARDLLDLAAPLSLSKRSGPVAFISQCYRHASAARIYGGTQEIHRSMIAERNLGLPRTRG